MKRTVYSIILLAVATAVFAGCRRDEAPSAPGEALVRIYLSAPGAATRAETLVADTEAERAISKVDVFAFDHASGNLVGGASVAPTGSLTSLELKVTNKPVDIYAVANAPDGIQSVAATRRALLAVTSSFSDNGASSFVMTASSVDVDPSANATVSLELQRVACKVRVKTVKKDLAISSKQNSTVKVKDLRLVNVRRQVDLFDAIDPAPAAAAASYINPQSFVETGNGMVGRTVDYTVTASGTDLGADGVSLYFYPNAAAEASDVRGDDWVTKLVMTVEVDGTDYYYPIGLPQDPQKAGRNLIYDVASVTLTLLGNPTDDSPNHYLADRSAEVSLNVLDWDELPVEPKYAAEQSTFVVAGLDAFTTPSGTKTVTVTSRQTNILGQVKALPWTFDISTDGGMNWTSTFPSWMNPSKTSGEGSVTGSESFTLTYKKSGMTVPANKVVFRFSQAESGRRFKIMMTE